MTASVFKKTNKKLPLHCLDCHLQVIVRMFTMMIMNMMVHDYDNDDTDYDHHDFSHLQFDDINLFFAFLVIGEVDKSVSSVSD